MVFILLIRLKIILSVQEIEKLVVVRIIEIILGLVSITYVFFRYKLGKILKRKENKNKTTIHHPTGYEKL